MVEVYDDVLSEKDLLTLQNVVMKNKGKSAFTWDWLDDVINPEDTLCDEIDNYQLSHTFYFLEPPKDPNFPPKQYRSMHFGLMMPILRSPKLKLDYPVRIKANLNVRTEKIVRHGFHIDNPAKNGMTAIFYVNTCNGYTEFEESGQKVYSKENRLCVFPSPTRHSGTTCTDWKRRVVININYIPTAK